jgi:2,3-bisphosphoglycerate-dependent phosphoglycerate mutase
MALLFLARHGETAWNASRRLTGIADILITAKGEEQAANIAYSLRGVTLDIAYTSNLKRTHQTLEVITTILETPNLICQSSVNFNERHCGVYTGHHKSTLDNEVLRLLDKDWSFIPPGGESLAMVSERVVSFFEAEIAPQLSQNRNILIVSHYNPMRLLKAYLEGVPKHERGNKGVGNGELTMFEY